MPDRNGYIGRAPSDSSVTVARQSYTASGITTDFTFSSGYTPGYFDIYINGVKMIEGSDYTSSDGSTFSILNGGASDGDALEAVAFKAFNAVAIDSTPGNFSVGGELSFESVAAGSSVSFATTAFNLDGTPDITVRNFTGVAGTFSGFVAFSTSISVGGTITYEDVENIDSVGLITARQGVEFGVSGVGGTVTATGQAEFAGVVTATSFVGDGSGLTGVASTDNIITGTAATFNNLVNVGSNIKIDAASGIVTATAFYGSGQNLTNLPAGGDSLDVTASLFI
jgi:hypothetical protein